MGIAALKPAKLSEPKETVNVLPLVQVADDLERRVREKREGLTEEEKLNKVHLDTTGKLAHLFSREFIHSPVEGTNIDQETAHLAEIAAYLHDIGKNGDNLLSHHLDSDRSADDYFHTFQGQQLTPEQRDKVRNAIRRHMGMPWLEVVALRTGLEKTNKLRGKAASGEQLEESERDQVLRWEALAKAEPMIESLGRYLPPNDEVSALLYSADLLTLGQTHAKGEDPKAGAFDKIVQIELGWGNSLMESVQSARESLVDNLSRLQTASPYTQEEKDELRKLGFGEEEFAGREKAARIEREVAKRFGPAVMETVDALVENIGNQPQEELEDTMNCYYRLARQSAEK